MRRRRSGVDLGGDLDVAGALGDSPFGEFDRELLGGLTEAAFVPVADEDVRTFEECPTPMRTRFRYRQLR